MSQPDSKDIPDRDRRWRCSECGSLNVQVSFPTWFREGRGYELVQLDIDAEANPHFYCEDCDAHDCVKERRLKPRAELAHAK